MEEKKFLEQVHSKIKKRESLNIELRDTCTEIVDKLYDEIQSIVCTVDENSI